MVIPSRLCRMKITMHFCRKVLLEEILMCDSERKKNYLLKV